MEQIGHHWMDLKEIWYFSFCRKSAEKIQVSLQSNKNNERVLYMTTNTRFLSYLSQFLLELGMFKTKL